jgi:Uma2 family endonuclease
VYEEAGVKEYWIIHPQEQIVLVYFLDADGKYRGIIKPYVQTDCVSSHVLSALTINLAQVFQR